MNMGPGHLGIAFAAKPVAPKAPLWALLVASEAGDLLGLVTFATGLDHGGQSQWDIIHGMRFLAPGSIPWSHGLFMNLVWSFVAAGIGYLVLRDRRASGMLGLAVLSHWVLDWITHMPNLPLFFDGSPNLGLGLWGTGPGFILSMILELALLAGGITIYVVWKKRVQLEKDLLGRGGSDAR